ncbi:CLUMA_CG006965, isoform A [Clunio marinus]|uniref:CLUMA_CG006965, isoform A n=1 Tax=Clunio marinus TaxID=568069 RepID=A0A1J1HZH6_9DIPT|nr:CLUMA_CG006965, isoform A [Clunio marinus]
MESRLGLAFKKCYFCGKNFNKLQLLEINGNIVSVNDEDIVFEDLIFDTCFIKIDSSVVNYICNECNSNLLSFHFFKREAKKYSNFREHIAKLEILSKAESFLNEIENLDEVHTIQDEMKFSISLGSEVDKSEGNLKEHEDDVVEFIEYCVEAISDESNASHYQTNHNISNETLSTDMNDLQAFNDEDSTVATEITNEIGENFTDSTLMSLSDSSNVRKRKLNTFDDLSEEQISWVRKQAQQSEIKHGSKRIYKCALCNVVLSTHSSLTRHIRDVHVLKGKNNEKEIVKEEANNSKIEIETSTGNEFVWKCQRCASDRIYRSLQAFKLHLRMTHLRATKLDTAFIASCKVSIEENGMKKNAWKCPECQRIFKHRDTLRHHIKIEHPNMDEIEAIRQNDEQKKVSSSTHSTIQFAESFKENQTKLSNNCDECGLKFAPSKQQMKPKLHNECHEMFKILSPNLPRSKCESCLMIFNSGETLYEHFQIHDNLDDIQPIRGENCLVQYGATFYKDPSGDADDSVDELSWKCGHCNVRYFNENDCVSHVMLLHTPSIHCFIDNREFKGATGLSKFMQHMKNKHFELFPDLTYPCGNCHEEFSSIYEKLAHQKICPSKKFQCDNCGKRFLVKHQLQAHILYEQGLTGFSCEICGKRCISLSDLKIHQNVHSSARPYECSICPKTFKTPAARSTHMEGHTLEGVTCEVCGQKLANRTLYQRHKKFQHDKDFRDTQMEKNKCDVCGKSFIRLGHLRQHMKHNHGM